MFWPYAAENNSNATTRSHAQDVQQTRVASIAVSRIPTHELISIHFAIISVRSVYCCSTEARLEKKKTIIIIRARKNQHERTK